MIENIENQKKNYVVSVLTVIAIFCMGQIPGSIDAAISKITTAFNLSYTTGLYVTTVSAIVSVIASVVVGFVAGKKISFRKIILFCAIVEMLGALLPFFADNFAVVLILRGLFGIGFGGMMSLENTIATKLITPEKRATMLGLGTFFGFGTNCLLQFVGGLLADIGWNYVFLTHLFLVIPFLILLFCCPEIKDEREVKEENKIEKKKGFSKSVYKIWILMTFVGIIIAPLLIGCSFLSTPIIDSATVAGIVAVCFSVGCMIGGICYPRIFEKLKENSLPLFLLITAIGCVGCAISNTIVALCIMIFIGGMGFSMTQATSMMVLGMTTTSSKIAIASAGMMSLFNLGMFLSSPFDSLVGAITGDSLYMPLYIGAVILMAFAIVFKIKSPFPKSNKIG